ncbi:hypothetical protein ACH5RR_004355 [Cinchona calisaya]|uniref:Uncharacterized protein n=1 Tax=Cinchona calisaya TaxID=153742 RepID=A0ABD3AY50_9GENT
MKFKKTVGKHGNSGLHHFKPIVQWIPCTPSSQSHLLKLSIAGFTPFTKSPQSASHVARSNDFSVYVYARLYKRAQGMR